MQGMWSDLPCK